VACNQKGKCTAYLRTHRILYLIVGRAVPWSLQIKNREKARERLYMSVCAPLTIIWETSGYTRAEGHEKKSEACCCFYPHQNDTDLYRFLCLNIMFFMFLTYITHTGE